MMAIMMLLLMMMMVLVMAIMMMMRRISMTMMMRVMVIIMIIWRRITMTMMMITEYSSLVAFVAHFTWISVSTKLSILLPASFACPCMPPSSLFLMMMIMMKILS